MLNSDSKISSVGEENDDKRDGAETSTKIEFVEFETLNFDKTEDRIPNVLPTGLNNNIIQRKMKNELFSQQFIY